MPKLQSKASAVPQAPQSGTYLRAAARELRHPHPVLSQPSRDVVDPCDPATGFIAQILIMTMRAAPACVGLAAPQIGQSVRVFCMDVTGHRKARSCAGPIVLVNPRIVSRSESIVMREGCMSVPDFTGDVARAAEVEVEGFEPVSGRVLRFAADGIEARCLQHEIDHLDGFLFVDRVLDPERDLFRRKKYA
jgi:peptide deformylase